MLKDIDFYHLQENINLQENYWMQDYMLSKLLPKKLHKAGEVLGNKNADAVTKSNDKKL